MREIALHILDLCRNSIEAGASTLDLNISEDPGADRLEIVLQDDGWGMEPEAVAHAADPFYSTRTFRRIGLGLSLFQAACQRCDGDLAVSSELGAGTTVRASLRLSHIDRPPLGDMGGVVQALACEAGRVRLRYTHRCRGGSFEIDTYDVHCPLGNRPLTDPSVLCWLAQFVAEELRALHCEPGGTVSPHAAAAEESNAGN